MPPRLLPPLFPYTTLFRSLPFIRPRCCLRYFTRFGINILHLPPSLIFWFFWKDLATINPHFYSDFSICCVSFCSTIIYICTQCVYCYCPFIIMIGTCNVCSIDTSIKLFQKTFFSC